MTSGETTPPRIATDLVEYFVLVIPGAQALSEVVPGLAHIVESEAIRILDLVAVELDGEGTPTVVTSPLLEELDGARRRSRWDGVLLSRHDIDLIALAIQPGDLAVVVVAEDRWAEPLAAAARALGGTIRAGERIAPERVQAAIDRARRASKESEDV